MPCLGMSMQQSWNLGTLSSYESILTVIYCIDKLLWSRLRVAFVYGHKHKYLESSLMPGQINKTIVHYSLGTVTSSVVGFWTNLCILTIQYQVWISFFGVSLTSTQKEVGIPITVMLLLHQRAHLAWQVDTVAFKVHCCLRWLSFLLWQPAWHLLPHGTLGSREGVSDLVLALSTSFPPRCVASSATWSYYLVQVDNGDSLCCFRGLWIFFWPTAVWRYSVPGTEVSVWALMVAGIGIIHLCNVSLFTCS